MAKRVEPVKRGRGRPLGKKRPRIIVSVSLDPDVVKRLDDVAVGNGVTRSRQVEMYVLEGLEEGEFAVKAFSNPAIMRAMGKMFADRSLVKQLAAAISSDTTPEQLKLFEHGLQNLEDSFKQKRGEK
jgi:hypothetical protein